MGGWPFAMIDYYVHGLMGLIDTDEAAEMFGLIDPYSKCIIIPI